MKEALQHIFASKLGVYILLSVVLLCLLYMTRHLDILEKPIGQDRDEE